MTIKEKNEYLAEKLFGAEKLVKNQCNNCENYFDHAINLPDGSGDEDAVCPYCESVDWAPIYDSRYVDYTKDWHLVVEKLQSENSSDLRIEIWFEREYKRIGLKSGWRVLIIHLYDGYMETKNANTIGEAVVNAAYEYLKGREE